MKKDNKNVVITSRLSDEYNEKLENLASQKRRKKADLIRIILEDYINLLANDG